MGCHGIEEDGMTADGKTMIRGGFLTTFTVAALATALFAPPAVARPPAENNGCPQEFEWEVVGEGEADRRVPREVDAVENGGNGGIVCARALGDGIFQDYPGGRTPYYGWADN